MAENGTDVEKKPFELGLYSFAELTPDAHTGEMITPRQRMQDLLESIELADQVGLDVFGLGEHHRPDFISSAPAVILGAAATRTERLRLSSAVSVISSDDPVRVFQRFATLDLISNGRAEIMAGRGSFIESFPLFGYDLHDYGELFEEKLELLLEIREDEQVWWSGKHRAPLTGQAVYPRPYQEPLPIWVAVGGTPESVVRAGRLGLPLAVAIIGGRPAQFAPLVQLYRETIRRSGHDPATAKVSINSHGYIADSAKQARDEAFPAYEMMMNRIGRERGWAPLTRSQYEASTTLQGANFIGSPDEIVEKILYQHEIFNHDRLLLQFTIGTMPHDKVMRSIELFGTKVAPVVREEIGRRMAAG
ncbi:MAG: LLM class flavin-dependent oxidoreductase [Candidatus Promineifilaceae bacterium]|nr:LLM class flavin-dependent oxidoreductase [Candidatus Promineifilaceae bacterium]